MSASRAIAQAQRSFSGMRILALPLTSKAASHGRHIFYYFQTPPPPPSPPISSKDGEGDGGKKSRSRVRSLVERATSKASETWAGFGEAGEGSWKKRLHNYGERVIDRMDFQELALKSMDTSLGPKVSKLGSNGLDLEDTFTPKIPLIHPTLLAPHPSSSSSSSPSPLTHLQQLVVQRTPSHRKGFYKWMAITPVTFPLKLIPVIPNIPFFFCVWRSWHHYRAYKASSYLESLLLLRNAIIPQPDSALDRIYEECRGRMAKAKEEKEKSRSSNACSDSGVGVMATAETAGDMHMVECKSSSPQPPSPKSSSSSSFPSPSTPSNLDLNDESLILDTPAIHSLVSHFSLPKTVEADLHRALEQTARSLEMDGLWMSWARSLRV
ncbi:hypothetical protein SCHPADRAFT_854179 [Schizopora paradoxa]|uniref:Mitochondrial K+-H+ exchange-related-domain-containing protein n=1 Tax=Schizopora paradoxa TaxID=27342 RepID=A0A0H2RRV5_9AGAM|nr:hypothetical protein SCHPADRAFT_854179 [Schizopora paradoxa]